MVEQGYTKKKKYGCSTTCNFLENATGFGGTITLPDFLYCFFSSLVQSSNRSIINSARTPNLDIFDPDKKRQWFTNYVNKIDAICYLTLTSKFITIKF